MKRERQKKILEIIKAHAVGTQEELVKRLSARGIDATQSSVSRDIVELRLTKLGGRYVAPQLNGAGVTLPRIELNTAGDHLIVLKTEVGQAQPVALKIDYANLKTIVGTLAGDDTVFIAVKDLANQKAAIQAIRKLFGLSKPRLSR
ncbi:MAG: arginine repressor [Acidobacteriota bacterium]